jgi:hypothetical protein
MNLTVKVELQCLLICVLIMIIMLEIHILKFVLFNKTLRVNHFIVLWYFNSLNERLSNMSNIWPMSNFGGQKTAVIKTAVIKTADNCPRNQNWTANRTIIWWFGLSTCRNIILFGRPLFLKLPASLRPGYLLSGVLNQDYPTSFPRIIHFRTDSLGDSDVGDIVMLVTLLWWLIWYVGGRIVMLASFFGMLVFFSTY